MLEGCGDVIYFVLGVLDVSLMLEGCGDVIYCVGCFRCILNVGGLWRRHILCWVF